MSLAIRAAHHSDLRMGGRVVEGTGLENRQAGDRLVGSNPTPSAIALLGQQSIFSYNNGLETSARPIHEIAALICDTGGR